MLLSDWHTEFLPAFFASFISRSRFSRGNYYVMYVNGERIQKQHTKVHFRRAMMRARRSGYTDLHRFPYGSMGEVALRLAATRVADCRRKISRRTVVNSTVVRGAWS